MADTALRERPTGSVLLYGQAEQAGDDARGLDDSLAFSALLREVLGDLRKDPAFLALSGKAEDVAAAPLEPAA